MLLCIVISKARTGEARITTYSPLDDILIFLSLLGVNGWELYDKGSARLEANGSNLYVAIGPSNPQDLRMFLKKAKSFCR